MNDEQFQPIPVTSPQKSPLRFRLRCLFDLQLKTIADQLQPTLTAFSSKKVIDVGAGESPWRDWLAPDCTYTGIDVGNASDFGMSERTDIVHYDGTFMPLATARFDVALCIEVLEHAADPKLLLSEISRILRPGGQLILSVPWSARRHHLPHDYHRFTRECLYQLLVDSGFDDIEIADRGNEYCTIFNKTLIALISNLKNMTLFRAPINLGMATILAITALGIFIPAHISLIWKSGKEDPDPLGYFCKAKRSAQANQHN